MHSKTKIMLSNTAINLGMKLLYTGIILQQPNKRSNTHSLLPSSAACKTNQEETNHEL